MSKGAIVWLAMLAALQLAACHRASTPTGRTAASAPAPSRPPPPAPPPPFTAEDASEALDTLRHAPDQGFPAARFAVAGIERALDAADPAEHAEGERRLRAAVLDYARAQHGLTIPTAALPRAWNQRPSDYDAEGGLNTALRAGTLQAWLDALPPQTADYRALQAAYVAARQGQAAPARTRIKPGPLQIGDQDERTRALRQRLGPQDADPADADAPVDQDLLDALQAYQTRHGLPATGELDAATAARLNAPVLGRAAKLRVNMERLRWLPRPEPAERIDVNVASAELDYVRDGERVTHMLAVSGKKGDETPILSSAVNSIELNPPWYVPSDIARREIVPKGEAYMRAHHFGWRDGRLVQAAGPKTALGLVKFNFPNPYAVYLHDTPSKASFALAQRTASHGCVRLQHAVELAKVVASDEPGLSAARVERVLATGRTTWLKLDRPIPVRLMYLTAEPGADGIVYLPDVYGWDPELLALLDRYSAPRRARAMGARAWSRPGGVQGRVGSAPSADRTR